MTETDRHPIYCVCDNIRSLENVGAIFRISDAARIAKLYLCGITPYPAGSPNDDRLPWVRERAHRVLAKTALSGLEAVPWEHSADSSPPLALLRDRGVQVVAVEISERSVDYIQADYTFPLALVLGHERVGVNKELVAGADLAVSIPTYGAGRSLNVSIAYAIVVYELLRRLRGGSAI
ncbi:MAG: TrmH family RNA methyltransferase [Chloroflexi bacterium]|nr:TrmH family RNA methyltransferase [Chloroflexota bacterium]